MTPQERQLVDELFERLARLESAPRDRDAERAIAEGLSRAPNAIYPLVQTVLVQDEALKRAEARIRELTGEEEAPQQGGFLDTMRNAFTGRSATSVPSVRPGAGTDSRWNTGGALANSNAVPNAAAAPNPTSLRDLNEKVGSMSQPRRYVQATANIPVNSDNALPAYSDQPTAPPHKLSIT